MPSQAVTTYPHDSFRRMKPCAECGRTPTKQCYLSIAFETAQIGDPAHAAENINLCEIHYPNYSKNSKVRREETLGVIQEWFKTRKKEHTSK